MNLTIAVVRHVVWKSDTREEEIKRGITVIPMITVMTVITVITMGSNKKNRKKWDFVP